MKLTFVTAALILAGSASFAETAATDSGWAGAYAGASFALGGGQNDYYGDGSSEDLYPLEGTAYGAFAGYRTDMGSFVVGGEVSLLLGPDLFETDYEGDYFYESITDLKATAGYSFNNVLAYASVGYSISTLTGSGDTNTMGGWLVGVGVDVMVTDSFFVGAEYVYRDVRNDDFWAANDGLNGQISTLQIRGGYRF